MKFPLSMIAQIQPEGPPPFLSLIPLLLMFLVFYFILIRPQRKKQTEQEAMIQNLGKNDEVVTAGGLHGTVVGLKEKTILLRIAENVRVEVDRSAIARVEKSRVGEEASSETKTRITQS